MNKLYSKIAMIFVALVSTIIIGCSTGYSPDYDEVLFPAIPAPGQATITFFWPQMSAATDTAPIAMLASNGELSLAGGFATGQKGVQSVTPGLYSFAIGGDTSIILKADLQPNKYYYVRIDPLPFQSFPNYTFVPVSGEQIRKDPQLINTILNCTSVLPNFYGEEWFQNNYKKLENYLFHPARVIELPTSYGLDQPI
ncbi:MAG: hypothetical protein LUC43_09895 [Burkholderiales bacterium]|nr:hypothetical protein [Burkholderiales bacterium]